jgi:SNF family Na+-dependent transporter
MGFRDEFGWSKNKGAWSLGAMILVLGLTVIFFKEGVFDEYDYWAGTVSLVVFAMFETILFSWILEWTKDGVKSQVVLISKSQIFINLSLNI